MNNQANITLYGCWRSSCTHRVRIAFSLLKIDYKYIPVNLDNREQDTDEFKKISRFSQLPVVNFNGKNIEQSMAIIAYAQKLSGSTNTNLFPEDPDEYVRSLSIAERVGSFIQPFMLPGSVRIKLKEELKKNSPSENIDAAFQDFIQQNLIDNLQLLDDQLAGEKSTYCVNDNITIADVFLFPQLTNAARMGIDVNSFPRLSKIYEALDKFPAIKAVAPDNLEDAPNNKNKITMTSDTSEKNETATTSSIDNENSLQKVLAYKEPDKEIARYLNKVVNKEIEGLDWIREETFKSFGPVVTKVSGVEVCRFLGWLTSQFQFKNVLEVGVFTGSSSLAILKNLPSDGRIDAIDISENYTNVAREAWKRAGRSELVNLIINDGVSALKELKVEPTYDLAYVDALNEHYQQYHQAIVPLMKKGGLIVFDNILWKGRVVDPNTTDPSAIHLRELNEILRDDQRLETTFISLGDGLALCRVI